MLRARYQTLNDREKLTLWVGAAVALVLILYLTLWRPLSSANQRLLQQIDDKQVLVGWMQQASAQVRQLQRSSKTVAPASTPLQPLITAQAARQGIKLERLQSRNDNEVQLWLDEVEFNALLPLLDQLNRQGVQLTKASLRASKTPGRVDAQLTFGR